MVWIHGGGYILGSGGSGKDLSIDGSALAVMHDVIVVTLNYRLGVLGFFNVPGTSTRGNYGMLDQIAALRWVKKNIAVFNGDPNKVTIFGESAGAGSVSLLAISPLIKGEKLFIRAIQQSGTASCPWASYQAKTNDVAKLFGASLGCKDMSTIVDCLRNKPVNDIMVKQTSMEAQVIKLLAPVVDNHFMTSLPWELEKANAIEAHNIEFMMGFNKDEGTMFALPAGTKGVKKTDFKHVIKLNTALRYPGKEDLFQDATFHEYTQYGQTNAQLKWADSSSEFLGEYMFKNNIVNTANSLARGGKTVYFYRLVFMPQHTNVPSWKVAHAIDLAFVFGTPFTGYRSFLQSNYTEEDRTVSRKVMAMWTDFAKNGNPGNSWPKYTHSGRQHMVIGSNLTTSNELASRMLEFWNDLVPKLTNVSYSKACDNKNNNIGSSSVKTESAASFLAFVLAFVMATFPFV